MGCKCSDPPAPAPTATAIRKYSSPSSALMEGGTASASARRTASYLVPEGRHYPEFSADLTRLNDINTPQRQPTMSLRDLQALHCE